MVSTRRTGVPTLLSTGLDWQRAATVAHAVPTGPNLQPDAQRHREKPMTTLVESPLAPLPAPRRGSEAPVARDGVVVAVTDADAPLAVIAEPSVDDAFEIDVTD